MSDFTVSIPEEMFESLVDVVVERVIERLDVDRGDGWPEYMDAKTAARFLGISVERVQKLKARREIPFHQEAAGCRVLFGKGDLREWMDTFRQGGGA